MNSVNPEVGTFILEKAGEDYYKVRGGKFTPSFLIFVPKVQSCNCACVVLCAVKSLLPYGDPMN